MSHFDRTVQNDVVRVVNPDPQGSSLKRCRPHFNLKHHLYLHPSRVLKDSNNVMSSSRRDDEVDGNCDVVIGNLATLTTLNNATRSEWRSWHWVATKNHRPTDDPVSGYRPQVLMC